VWKRFGEGLPEKAIRSVLHDHDARVAPSVAGMPGRRVAVPPAAGIVHRA
jgi:hypothetical protein